MSDSQSVSPSNSNSMAETVDDESSNISSVSTIGGSKAPIDFSSLPSNIEIHPQHASLAAGSTSCQQFIKRPLNAYMIWTVEQRQKIQREPRQKMNEISRAMGEVWKKMSSEEKAPYFVQAKKYAEEHKKALRDNPNLAYVPSRKKMRLSLKTEKDDSVSNPSSPDMSDIPDSPAPSTRGHSFGPMSPVTLAPTQSLPRITTIPSSISYVSPKMPYHSGSQNSFTSSTVSSEDFQAVNGHTTIRIIPASRIACPTNPTVVENGYSIITTTTQQTQMMNRPPMNTQTAPQPQPQPDVSLTSTQIADRYFASLCLPMMGNPYDGSFKLRESNYYYDLHFQLFKKTI